MFELAFGIGIYSYLIFALGILHLLYPLPVIFLTIVFVTFFVYFLCINIQKTNLKKLEKGEKLVALLLILLASLNFIGTLVPELSFDALWYHLTLPKIYIISHSIGHINGGLLYYSDMPKLIDLIFIPAILFGNELLAKFVHFSFGIFTCIALYKLSRVFLDRKLSLVAVLVFYSNIVVAWLSTVAYIDLGRTFFEVMSFLGIIYFFKAKKLKWLIESALLMGLAISSKLLSLESLLIYFVLFYYFYKFDLKKSLKDFFLFACLSLLMCLPWFIFSYLNTGNPIYPFFTQKYDITSQLHLPNLTMVWNFFTSNQDPISPLYIIFLPLILLFTNKFKKEQKMIVIYVFVSLILWYITPKSGGGRFITAYLPVFSLLTVIVIEFITDKNIKKLSFTLIIFTSLITLSYRGIAQSRYIPYLLGKETKREFLSSNLNFNYGDFYDTDGYLTKNISNNDKVLLYGFHNLFYINFPFIDSSWVKKGDKFDYVATRHSEIPDRFKNWILVYYNSRTGVKLYTLNKTRWIY